MMTASKSQVWMLAFFLFAVTSAVPFSILLTVAEGSMNNSPDEKRKSQSKVGERKQQRYLDATTFGADDSSRRNYGSLEAVLNSFESCIRNKSHERKEEVIGLMKKLPKEMVVKAIEDRLSRCKDAEVAKELSRLATQFR